MRWDSSPGLFFHRNIFKFFKYSLNNFKNNRNSSIKSSINIPVVDFVFYGHNKFRKNDQIEMRISKVYRSPRSNEEFVNQS